MMKKIEKSQIRINADDFGLSPGVNIAIIRMFQENKLSSASMLTTCDFFNEAVRLAKSNKGLQIGLHFCITTGKSISGHNKLPNLTDKNGYFKHGFVKLLLLSIFKPSIKTEVVTEFLAQLNKIEQEEIKVRHIDGHRHIHIIPLFYKIIIRECENRDIVVRCINENIFCTLKSTFSLYFLLNGNFIKWMLLRFLMLFNKVNHNLQYKKTEYFFSILHTCNITQMMLDNLHTPGQFDRAEVMIHPSDVNIDFQNISSLKYEKPHLLSKNRLKELW